MRRTKDTPGVVSYYETLQEIFSLEARVLTGVLPHNAERGRNDEERFRAFLSRVLPRRFSVGSGFIVCSEAAVPMSSQTDVVIFDEIYNSPLHRELAAFVYPVEMVYGTVEVKGTLTRENLLETCRAIQKVRVLSLHQHYVEYKSVAPNPEQPKARVAMAFDVPETLAPRAFVFAYGKKGWRNIDALETSVRDAALETGAHIHGLAVLMENWYLSQYAHTNAEKWERVETNALLHFLRGMLHSIASRQIVRPAFIDRYLNAPAAQHKSVSPKPSHTPMAKRRGSTRRKRRP